MPSGLRGDRLARVPPWYMCHYSWSVSALNSRVTCPRHPGVPDIHHQVSPALQLAALQSQMRTKTSGSKNNTASQTFEKNLWFYRNMNFTRKILFKVYRIPIYISWCKASSLLVKNILTLLNFFQKSKVINVKIFTEKKKSSKIDEYLFIENSVISEWQL